ncbi:MAG: chemotaxis protein CheV [Gammaproteobacteria bacterium]|nr:chemotaxis protein CheV [Gammaproteobacteria bacterium]
MASLMDSVDQRTQLAGHNRLELLLFSLGGKQEFGINVFKVKEVILCPPLTKLPNAHPIVLGVAHLRGQTISVMDLSLAIGGPPIENVAESYVIITEYNRTTQGFLVHSVNQIINKNWEDILPPPKGSGEGSYLTAVTKHNDDLIEVLDVEKVMAEVVGMGKGVSDDLADDAHNVSPDIHTVLVVDDSSVARNQIKRTLDQIGYQSKLAKNGKEGLDILKQWASEGPIQDRVMLVISDIEMPIMDGYTLTTEIRKDPGLQGLYIILHTSLSGIFNNAMVKKVGANKFVPKFNADDLANTIMESLQDITGSQRAAS